YIDVQHLDKDILSSETKRDFIFDYNKAKEKQMKKFMRSYLSILLSLTDGNISKAARLANIERQSLQKLIKKYEINPEEFRKK
ncbi:MAG: sigma-54-dependent Fis family transcriptional regulator, partial [Aquificota bacterium]